MNTPDYDGWDQEIFDRLGSDDARRAYDLAAYLHHGVPRKDARPYLGHINGSLQKLEQYNHLLGGIDVDTMQMYVCLHDIIEDDDDGVELIEKEFGIEVLIAVLWMSIPKKRVRDGVAKLIRSKPEYSRYCLQFKIYKYTERVTL